MPKRMKESEFNRAREELSVELVQLKEAGEGIRVKDAEAKKATGWWSSSRKRSAVQTSIKNYEIAVKDVSRRYELLKIQANYNRRAHPLFYVLKLILGLIFIIVTLLWIIHIVLYMVLCKNYTLQGLPLHPFLNNVFLWLEEHRTNFLAVACLGFFAYYLLWACVQGNIKFGMRMFCFTFYPMAPGETFMNSFLVNVLLFNIWSVALAHFCTLAFADYARFTDATLIFTVQLQHLVFFKYLWEYKVFLFALLGITVVSTFYLLCRPSDRIDVSKMLLKRKK
eukprot:TRINITY_DN5521_c0_g1_i11.p1 TRINITY_DN5521_c0_g1~~TRINITY_DN5521_c0_g1_i11.p1  ORF type:complete len:281 (+),score=70.50 TRINITY_DN5521_c0_g1_i11:856-1698(+)